MLRNSIDRYGLPAQLLHWLIALLVVVQIYLALSAFENPDKQQAAELLALHRPLGVTLLMLMLLRLGWRLLNPQPALPSSMATGTRFAARATHALFYILIIAIPLTGWVKAGAEGTTVGYFGLFAVPAIAANNADLAATLKFVHLLLNTALLALLPVHFLAALWHQFGRRDGVLRRMLPGG